LLVAEILVGSHEHIKASVNQCDQIPILDA
jgi:hypothetical protein